MAGRTIDNIDVVDKHQYQTELPFEELVGVVDAHTLCRRLCAVLRFINSDRTTLTSVSSIASTHIDVIIVKIVQNRDNLHCLLHHPYVECRMAAAEIMDKLKDNELDYKLVYGYSRNRRGKLLLTFTKLYINKLFNSNSNGSIQTECANGTRPVSQSTPEKQNVQNNKSPTTKCDGSTITDEFRTLWLQTTLDFIKDGTRTNLEYPEMSAVQAEFICSLFWQHYSPSVRKTNMADCVPVWEAMKIIGLKYEFRLAFMDTFKTDALCPDMQVFKVIRSPLRLSLEKVPKTNPSNTAQVENKDVLDKMSLEFMKMSSQTILDFLHDEFRSTLVFEGVKPLEDLFLQSVTTSTKPIFQEHEKLLDYLEKSKPTRKFDIKIEVGRLNRITKLKNVMFLKVPKFDSECIKENLDKFKMLACSGPLAPDISRPMQSVPDHRQLGDRKTQLLEALAVPVESDKAKKMMQSMGWNGGPLGIRGEGITEPIMPHLNHKSGAGLGHVPAKKNTPTTRSTAKTQLKTQETQPPDVASNGHELTNLSYTMQNSNVEFRAKVLTALLDLVEKRSEIYIMRFQEVLSSEEMSFIMSFVCALNKRTRVAFTTREEAILNHQLMSCMKQSKDLSITCSFDNNNKRVTFVRVKPKANKWTKPPHTKASRCLSPSCVVIQRGKDGSWPDTMPSAAGLPRSQKKMNFRIFLLVNMLELLNAANIRQKTLYFNCSRKKKTFAREAATILNDGNKSLRSIITVYENDLVMDISEFYGQVSIDFEFIQAHKKCIMKKIFKKNVNNNSVKSDKVCHSVSRLTDETATSMNSSNSESNPEMNCSSVCSETLSQNSLQDSYHSPKVLFRIGVFKSFLELMENEAQELVVSYKKRLTHKEISFIHHIINTLNKRVRMALNIAEEIRLESKLSGLMRNNRGLMIHGSVNGDKKELAIKKWAIINPREKGTPETTLNPKQVYISKNPDGTWSTTFQPPHEVNESVNSFNYRVFMLVNVLEFLKNKQEDTRELSFVEQVCEEYYEYAKSLVAMVNNKQKSLHHGTDFEKSIMCDISEFCQDINLNLVFHESSRKFILMKVCLKKDIIKTENVPINNTSECINIEVIDNDDLKSYTDDSTDKHLVSTLEYDKILKSDDQTSLEIVKEKIDKKYVITNKIIHDTNKNSMESETASFTKKSHKDLENVFYDNDDVFTDESNCNIEIKNENDAIVNHLSSSSKRSRSDSAESMPDNSKKTKILYFENSQKLSIVPKDYPRKIMTKESLIELQNIISESIDKEDELPLLQCHGIQDGVLVYACHNERSLFFLENTLNLASDFKIIDNNTEEDECYNMKIKINTLCQNLSKIFNRLESYNAGLNTDNWCVTDIKTNIDNIIISVDIDKESYDYVCFNNFCLYVGIDIARFSVVWD